MYDIWSPCPIQNIIFGSNLPHSKYPFSLSLKLGIINIWVLASTILVCHLMLAGEVAEILECYLEVVGSGCVFKPRLNLDRGPLASEIHEGIAISAGSE